MDSEMIRSLLEKYWKAETTVEEERELLMIAVDDDGFTLMSFVGGSGSSGKAGITVAGCTRFPGSGC